MWSFPFFNNWGMFCYIVPFELSDVNFKNLFEIWIFYAFQRVIICSNPTWFEASISLFVVVVVVGWTTLCGIGYDFSVFPYWFLNVYDRSMICGVRSQEKLIFENKYFGSKVSGFKKVLEINFSLVEWAQNLLDVMFYQKEILKKKGLLLILVLAEPYALV